MGEKGRKRVDRFEAVTYLALKDVEQAEPMPHFMRRTAALVVIRGGSAGDTVRENVAAVFLKCRAGSVGPTGSREVTDPEQSAPKVGKEVDIEVGVVSLA